MYALEVRDHIMIAHSLAGEAFGPAQKTHGATFVVDATFFRPQLTENDIVVDIGLASDELKAILAEINYQDLDQHPDFTDRRSTTEKLAKWVFDKLCAAIKAGKLGDDASGIERIRVTMNESHVARGWFEAPVSI
ncbi:MAG: 6-carboxytetrahydropterin synthase [Pseudomonadota bacterium]